MSLMLQTLFSIFQDESACWRGNASQETLARPKCSEVADLIRANQNMPRTSYVNNILQKVGTILCFNTPA
jgi:hypothetical protein